MTLDEAIKHCMDIAETQEMCSNGRECAKEHRQLAKWLKDYKRLLEQTGWIPVSERLPEENGEYLIAIKDRGYAEISWFYPHNKKWSYRNADIVAWTYIPKPYKAESEDKK